MDVTKGLYKVNRLLFFHASPWQRNKGRGRPSPANSGERKNAKKAKKAKIAKNAKALRLDPFYNIDDD
jgi:hypothetical protein